MSEPGVIELRVHGVSGTPPEELLNTKIVRQVAGNGSVGFYRPRLREDLLDIAVGSAGPPGADAPLLEGYSWGGLTSGAASRALWLLLLPFTLSNVAPRMRPLVDGESRAGACARWLIWYLSRLIALAMTALFVIGAAGVSIDLYAWQCGDGSDAARPDCSRARPSWLIEPLLGMSVQHRLALGAVLPMALMLGLLLLSKRTINQYESVSVNAHGPGEVDPPTPVDAPTGPNTIEPQLSSRWMWRNEHLVRRLRQLHLQVSFAIVLWVVLAPMHFALRPLCRVAVLAVVVYSVCMLASRAYTGRLPSRRMMAVNVAVWMLLAALAAVCAGLLLLDDDVLGGNPGNVVPGFAGTATLVFMVLNCLVAAFSVLIAWCAWRWRSSYSPSDGVRPLWGLSAIVVAVMGVFTGAIFASGTYVFAAAWLVSGSARPSYEEATTVGQTFQFPDIVQNANRAFAVSAAFFVAFVVCLAVGLLVSRRKRVHRYQAILESAYGSDPVRADPRRARAVAASLWSGRQVDYASRYLGALSVIGAIVSIGFLVVLFSRSGPLCEWAHYPAPPGSTCATDGPKHGVLWTGWLSGGYLQQLGAYLTITALLGLVALGAAAFRVAKTRRSVGILWDVASFWPRAAHPFAAPCYAERTVPDLVTRVLYYVEGEGRKSVVISGHSQGTVISAATLFQLDALTPARRASIGFLSFGCVLRRLYGRFFPVYFGAERMDRLRLALGGPDQAEGPASAARATRWRNLWRYSDYLGGAVFTGPPQPLIDLIDGAPPDPDFAVDHVDHRLIDPVWGRPPGDTQWPKPNSHSNYWADPLFPAAAALVASRLSPPPAPDAVVGTSATVGSGDAIESGAMLSGAPVGSGTGGE